MGIDNQTWFLDPNYQSTIHSSPADASFGNEASAILDSKNEKQDILDIPHAVTTLVNSGTEIRGKSKFSKLYVITQSQLKEFEAANKNGGLAELTAIEVPVGDRDDSTINENSLLKLLNKINKNHIVNRTQTIGSRLEQSSTNDQSQVELNETSLDNLRNELEDGVLFLTEVQETETGTVTNIATNDSRLKPLLNHVSVLHLTNLDDTVQSVTQFRVQTPTLAQSQYLSKALTQLVAAITIARQRIENQQRLKIEENKVTASPQMRSFKMAESKIESHSSLLDLEKKLRPSDYAISTERPINQHIHKKQAIEAQTDHLVEKQKKERQRLKREHKETVDHQVLEENKIDHQQFDLKQKHIKQEKISQN